MNNYILDDDGNPVPCDDIIEWATWMEKADRRVGLDQIGDIKVSTVFLGLDHNLYGGSIPVLYETMIFGGAHDQYQERYSTKEEALTGHKVAVELVKGESK